MVISWINESLGVEVDEIKDLDMRILCKHIGLRIQKRYTRAIRKIRTQIKEINNITALLIYIMVIAS